MFIDLLTISKSGIFCDFDESSPEMSEAFMDILGNTPFKVHVTVKPVANAYKISGNFSSHSKDVCSRCGYAICYPVQGSINEIVVMEKQRPRNTQISQSLKNFDMKEPGVTYINEYRFDLKEFLHEIIASSLEPFPVCKDTRICRSRRFDLEEEESPRGHPGFNLLKDFKLRP